MSFEQINFDAVEYVKKKNSEKEKSLKPQPKESDGKMRIRFIKLQFSDKHDIRPFRLKIFF